MNLPIDKERKDAKTRDIALFYPSYKDLHSSFKPPSVARYPEAFLVKKRYFLKTEWIAFLQGHFK